MASVANGSHGVALGEAAVTRTTLHRRHSSFTLTDLQRDLVLYKINADKISTYSTHLALQVSNCPRFNLDLRQDAGRFCRRVLISDFYTPS